MLRDLSFDANYRVLHGTFPESDEELQMWSIDDDWGVFEPKGRFLELDIVDQIDLLNDRGYDLDQYRKHLLCSLFFDLAKKGDNLNWDEKQAVFRKTATCMGLDIPDDFESFGDAHRELKSLPIKPCSCPVCNPDDD